MSLQRRVSCISTVTALATQWLLSPPEHPWSRRQDAVELRGASKALATLQGAVSQPRAALRGAAHREAWRGLSHPSRYRGLILLLTDTSWHGKVLEREGNVGGKERSRERDRHRARVGSLMPRCEATPRLPLSPAAPPRGDGEARGTARRRRAPPSALRAGRGGERRARPGCAKWGLLGAFRCRCRTRPRRAGSQVRGGDGTAPAAA